MGRRALRTISTETDLSQHLRDLDSLPLPIDTAAIFGRTAPLEIEIGTGKGLFLANAARGEPDRNYIGVEIAGKYARFAAARLFRADQANATIIHGDAERFFADWITAESVEAVHIYFPDPWWKKRHHKRRIMNCSMLTSIHRALRENGRLHFWTDVEDYYEQSLELIAAQIPLRGPLPVDERSAEHDMDYRTHFERRVRLHEEAVFRSEFVKARS